MPASVSKIGHIVLKVEDADSAVAFYCGVLGLKEVARRDFGEGPMAFPSTGNSHHDVTLVAANPPNSGPGSLHHFALKVGESLQDLRHVKQALAAEGIVVHMSRVCLAAQAEPAPRRGSSASPGLSLRLVPQGGSVPRRRCRCRTGTSSRCHPSSALPRRACPERPAQDFVCAPRQPAARHRRKPLVAHPQSPR